MYHKRNRSIWLCCLAMMMAVLMALSGCRIFRGHEEETQTEQPGTSAQAAAETASAQPAPETSAPPQSSPSAAPQTQATENVTELPDAPAGDESTQSSVSASNGIHVAIDAGHQQKSNSELEPIGPGADESKAKVASGTQGVSTGIPEYQLNLDVSLLLQQELVRRGYTVTMIRTTNDVNISNKERADMAALAGADIFVRVHANGSENSGASGTCAICPSGDNPYMDPQLISSSQQLSQNIVDHVSASTGFANLGIIAMDNMSGINWCTIPVSIVEMGFMTNPGEDEAMADPACRQRIASGIADGVDAYFNR